MTDHATQPRVRWLLALLALAAALFLVVASACGGDDDDDDGGDSEPTATESTDGGDDGGDDGSDDFDSLSGDYEKFEGYVKYEAHDFSADDTLESMAIYQEGDKSRVDISSSEGLVTIIDTPDASYVCSENQCLKYPAGNTGGVGSLFTSFIDPTTIEDQFGNADYDESEEEIAGLSAKCFSAQNGEVCFGEGGLLLRTSSDEGTLEAVEADTDIPDDAFEPPFDVIDLGDLGQ
ncbi:MAG TPA: hypothetical protein VFP63_00315 [Dehalococcoidia bacterium]|nr:hypothetical protein [Dehalococcoidia bacterium]